MGNDGDLLRLQAAEIQSQTTASEKRLLDQSMFGRVEKQQSIFRTPMHGTDQQARRARPYNLRKIQRRNESSNLSAKAIRHSKQQEQTH